MPPDFAGKVRSPDAELNDVMEPKHIEQELFGSCEQFRELSAYMEAIREEERKRIAMEMHDELGQLQPRTSSQCDPVRDAGAAPCESRSGHPGSPRGALRNCTAAQSAPMERTHAQLAACTCCAPEPGSHRPPGCRPTTT